MNNFGWYLKQSLCFTTSVLKMEFLDEIKNLFILNIFTTEETVKYTFRKVYHKSSSYMTSCAVINGRTLLLSDFKKAVVPPPLHSRKIIVDDPINFFSFNNKMNSFIVVDSQYKAYFYSYSEGQERLLYSVNICNLGTTIPLQFSHFAWHLENSLFCSFLGAASRIDLSRRNTTVTPQILEEDPEDNVTTLMFSADNLCLIKQNKNCITLEGSSKRIYLPFLATHIDASFFGCKSYVFALTPSSIFFINSTEIANNVSSFLVHGGHLLLTTTDNKLFALNSNDIETAVVGNLHKCFFRSIEQGAELVCGLLDECDAVLQMPRGNVESVSCVVVAIRFVSALICSRRWLQALQYIRQKKLDVNIIVDLDFKLFFANIASFIEAAFLFKALDSFILALNDDNVLNTMYKTCNITPANVLEDKKKAVCTELLKYMEVEQNPNFISSIMVCHYVSKTIDKAVLFIKYLFNNSNECPSFIQLAENSLNVLLLYVVQEDLYIHVLRHYNTTFATFSCRIFKMDPKIYEPFFAKLENLSETERRFEINDHIKFHADAAQYLICINNVEIDRILKYMRTHNLHKEMYRCCLKNENTNLFKHISLEYGKFLISCKHFAEAGCVHSRAECWDEAYECYKKINMWEEALMVLNYRNLTEAEMAFEKKSIANELIKSNEILSASKVFEEYCNLPELAIKALSKHNYFKEALRLVKKHKVDAVLGK